MSAEEMRQYIMLVESARSQVAEADIGRRGLFRGAAALAAVAALPQGPKDQAIKLIKDQGPTLARAVASVKDAGLKYSHFGYLSIMSGNLNDDDIDVMGIFPDRVRALEELTGAKLSGLVDDPKTRHTYQDDLPDDPRYRRAMAQVLEKLGSLDIDGRMGLIDSVWKRLGLGDDPYMKAYQLCKEFPRVLPLDDPDLIDDIMVDFVPGFRGAGTRVPTSGEGINNLRLSLSYYQDQEREAVESGNKELADKARREQEHFAHLIAQHGGMTGSSTQKASPADHPRTSASPTSLLRAVWTVLNAFRSDKVVNKDSLDMLKDIKPEDIKLTMQQDSGQEPEAPQKPAALPAPGSKIDLGLDRVNTPEPVVVRRDQT